MTFPASSSKRPTFQLTRLSTALPVSTASPLMGNQQQQRHEHQQVTPSSAFPHTPYPGSASTLTSPTALKELKDIFKDLTSGHSVAIPPSPISRSAVNPFSLGAGISSASERMINNKRRPSLLQNQVDLGRFLADFNPN